MSNSLSLFIHSVKSDSLQTHGLQNPRLLLSFSLLKLMSISRWCHPTTSSFVIPFSSCLQSFPTSGYFPMSQLFTSGGQNIGVSASKSVLPVSIQDWFPLGWTGWISLQSKGLSKESSPTPQFKRINSLALSFLYGSTLTSIHDYWKKNGFYYSDLCRQSDNFF